MTRLNGMVCIVVSLGLLLLTEAPVMMPDDKPVFSSCVISPFTHNCYSSTWSYVGFAASKGSAKPYAKVYIYIYSSTWCDLGFVIACLHTLYPVCLMSMIVDDERTCFVWVLDAAVLI